MNNAFPPPPWHHVSRWGLPLLLTLLLTMAGGCSRNAQQAKAPPPPAPPPAEKSNVDTLVDGLTGRTAVQAGARARASVNDVNAKREADIAEMDKF